MIGLSMTDYYVRFVYSTELISFDQFKSHTRIPSWLINVPLAIYSLLFTQGMEWNPCHCKSLCCISYTFKCLLKGSFTPDALRCVTLWCRDRDASGLNVYLKYYLHYYSQLATHWRAQSVWRRASNSRFSRDCALDYYLLLIYYYFEKHQTQR